MWQRAVSLSTQIGCIRQFSPAGCETRAVTITPMDFGFPSCRGRIFYLHLHKKKLRSMMAEGKMDIPPAFDEFCSNIMDSIVSTSGRGVQAHDANGQIG